MFCILVKHFQNTFALFIIANFVNSLSFCNLFHDVLKAVLVLHLFIILWQLDIGWILLKDILSFNLIIEAIIWLRTTHKVKKLNPTSNALTMTITTYLKKTPDFMEWEMKTFWNIFIIYRICRRILL